ncbi:hypothetical protein JW698_02980 [Candidatus Wolfebacteria bacterium]|nr:hypothetical protein [Candidatus Wolfebacteria bacterium]
MKTFIIPGFFTGKKFYNKLINNFEKKGLTIECIDLGLNFKSLKNAAEKTACRLKKFNGDFNVIAYSFGGLIFKEVIFKNPDIFQRVKSLNFVAVPHYGTWGAVIIPFFPATLDMLPIRKHINQLLKIPLPEKTVNFISQNDIVILPKKFSLLKDCVNITIPNVNHKSIIRSAELFSQIEKNLTL